MTGFTAVRFLLICMSMMLAASLPAAAKTIWVPDDYSMIQTAIQFASPGDVVRVRPGVYKERINFLGKAITVESEQGPDVTTINGMYLGGGIVTFLNGEKGILEYRGYPIEQLAERSNFLETTFLLINGELPTQKQLASFTKKVMKNSAYHDGLEPFIKAFRHDAHPMAMMSTLMAAMSSFYPEANPAYVGANIYKTRQERNKHIYRVIGCAPAIAAACYRHRIGKPIIPPKEDLGYIENFLYMMDALPSDNNYRPHPKIVKAIEVLFSVRDSDTDHVEVFQAARAIIYLHRRE